MQSGGDTEGWFLPVARPVIVSMVDHHQNDDDSDPHRSIDVGAPNNGRDPATAFGGRGHRRTWHRLCFPSRGRWIRRVVKRGRFGVRREQRPGRTVPEEQESTLEASPLMATVVLDNRSDYYLLDLVRENLPCHATTVVTGQPNSSTAIRQTCRCIVEYCQEQKQQERNSNISHPATIRTQCPRTKRTPLHEAAARGLCAHIMRALLTLEEQTPQTTENGSCEKTAERVETTIRVPPQLQLDAAGNTPLHLSFLGGLKHQHDDSDRTFFAGSLELLLRPDPGSVARQTNRDGNLPLHLAVSVLDGDDHSNNKVIVVQKLLQIYPEAAIIPNRKGQTPLHVHCQQSRASLLVAQELIAAATEASTSTTMGFTTDTTGYTPLHHAAAARNVALVLALIQADPRAALVEVASSKRTVLHLLCASTTSSSIVDDNNILLAIQALVKAAPSTVTHQDSISGATPLHVLLENNNKNRLSNDCIMDCIQALVDAAPDVLLHIPDRPRQWLPLHVVCAYTHVVDPAVVACLLTPTAAAARTRKGDTALHCLCRANSSNDNSNGPTSTHLVQTVHRLLVAHSAAAAAANAYGYLPLHEACRVPHPNVKIIQALVRAYPAALQAQTHAGETPVHLLAGKEKDAALLDVSVVGSSISNESEQDSPLQPSTAAANKNEQSHAQESSDSVPGHSNTPLHYAVMRHNSTTTLENLEALAALHPEWITTKAAGNHQHANGGQTPVQILCQQGRMNKHLVDTLSRLNPNAFGNIDSGGTTILTGHTPLHSYLRGDVPQQRMSVSTVRAMIRAHPGAVAQTTQYGDTPLHLACFRPGIPVEVVSELARASCRYPKTNEENRQLLLLCNTAGQSPFSIALNDYRRTRGKRPCRREKLRNNTIKNASQSEIRAFDVLATLVKVLHYGPVDDDDDDEPLSLVRACLLLHQQGGIRLEASFIREVLHRYPNEVKVADKNDGNYPLHLEASLSFDTLCCLDDPTEDCWRNIAMSRATFLGRSSRQVGDAGIKPWPKSFALTLWP